MPEIYVIVAIPLKCVAVLFRMSPEGNTTLSAIRPSSLVKVHCGNIPDTLVPEIYVIMAIPLKCVAVLFRMSPEGNTTLSAIRPLS